MSKAAFEGRLALVTGASRGFGRALALSLAKEGAHVIAVARKKEGLEALDDAIKALGGEATLVPLDLTRFDGIDELGLRVFERWKRLDILVGNAGILGPLTPFHQVSPKEWQEVIDLNLTANFRLIRSFDPLLRASTAGRVAFVTSGVTSRVRGYWGPYAVAKAGVEMLLQSYAAENAKGTIKANLMDPGAMRTAMRAAAYPGEDPMSLPAPEEIAPKFLKILTSEWNETGRRYGRDDL